MHNDLKITQEDIRNWIKEDVERTARRMCQQAFDSFNPEQIIRNIMFDSDYFGSNTIIKQIRQEMAKQFLESFEITIQKKI